MKKILFSILVLFFVIPTFGQGKNLNILEGETVLPTTHDASYDLVMYYRTLEKGKFYAFALATPLDGYYFGADVKRYIVNSMTPKTSATYIIDYTPMQDTEDFLPQQLYIIEAPENISSIISVTAGKQTKVTDGTQPLCLIDVTESMKSSAEIITNNKITSNIEAIYSVTGQKISNPQKGINILKYSDGTTRIQYIK